MLICLFVCISIMFVSHAMCVSQIWVACSNLYQKSKTDWENWRPCLKLTSTHKEMLLSGSALMQLSMYVMWSRLLWQDYPLFRLVLATITLVLHNRWQWTLFRPFRPHQCSWCDRDLFIKAIWYVRDRYNASIPQAKKKIKCWSHQLHWWDLKGRNSVYC